MKLWFLPVVREGLLPTESAGPRAQTRVSLLLEAAGQPARDVGRTLPLLGPGDVLAIEPRQVLRTSPAADTPAAEPDFFPAIEFDAPDLPWCYSPLLPEGNRVAPWIVLLVVEAGPDVQLLPGQPGQSPWVLRLTSAVAARELPDLADAWAWAHAQVACASAGEVAATLAAQPDRTLSRLLAPRRLKALQRYHACVVPAFLAGRIAGLGGDPSAHPALVTGHEPAWSPADLPAELPAYHAWSFRTGEAGDFESLARRLHAAPPETELTATPLWLSVPGADSVPAVDWEPPLRVPGTLPSRPRRPDAVAAPLAASLTPGTADQPVLGPAYFGEPWRADRALAPLTDWAPELNLTPMWRAAAGLGAEAVRGEQEALVAAVADQLQAFQAEQRAGWRRQLGLAVVRRLQGRLAQAPAAARARVLAPVAAAAQQSASDVGAWSAAGRRLARKAGRALPVLPATFIGPLPSMVEAVVYRPVLARTPVALPPSPAPADPTTVATGEFVPRLARPMCEPLAERQPELMLPGASALAADGALLVEANDGFVEAYLVGANQELAYELLWRGIPAAFRATPFRRFWPRVDTADATDGTDAADDIGDIAGWAAGAVGSHVQPGASMILLLRSELVRRYPSVLVSAVPAQWNADGTRTPSADVARARQPLFRGRIGADVLYAGFSAPSLDDALGGNTPAAPAGWYFLLAENPGDPRFGLDPAATSTPESPPEAPTRATLAWHHLALRPDAPWATATALPAVPDAGFTPALATAARIAGLLRQRPFRVFLHASLLLRRPPSS